MPTTDINTESRDGFWALFRSSIDEGIEEEGQDGDNSLNETLQSCIHTTTFRYANTTAPTAEIEPALHSAWYECIQAAKHMDCANYKQDALVRTIVAAKAMGHLRRPQPIPGDDERSEGDGELVCFPDGARLWADLPFFGTDLVDEWANRYYLAKHYDAAQRCYLAAFVGRLLSVGIFEGPATCLLSLFRETLETERPLVSLTATEANGTDGDTGARLPIADLLDALQQLLMQTEGGIRTLRYHYSRKDSPTGASDSVAQLSSLGELAVQSVAMVSAGYSPERWTFWKNRLQELAKCDDEDIAGNAESCLLCIHGEADGKLGTFLPMEETLGKDVLKGAGERN